MKLALIQCSARKKSVPCVAKELYSESLLFKSSLDYTLLNYENIAILSAKHYCVGLEEMLEPYNVCLNDFKKKEKEKWSEITCNLILKKYPDLTECHFYTGRNYRRYLIPMLESKGIKCYSHLEHLGLGQKIVWFRNHTTIEREER